MDIRAERDSKGIKSVEIGYRVLLAVQQGPESVKLSDIARRCGLTSGATHNYITSLVRTGLVEQEDRGRYRLGPSAFALSLASFRQLRGYDVLRDAARGLNARTGQSTAVAVWSQGGPVSVFIVRSEDVGNFDFRSGHLPLLDSGAGLVFLAYLHDSHTRPLLEMELAAEGRPSGAEDIDALIASLRAEVLSGPVARHEYAEPGHTALSAPVQLEDGRLPFVLSIIIHGKGGIRKEARWAKELASAARTAAEGLAREDVGGPVAEHQVPRQAAD